MSLAEEIGQELARICQELTWEQDEFRARDQNGRYYAATRYAASRQSARNTAENLRWLARNGCSYDPSETGP